MLIKVLAVEASDASLNAEDRLRCVALPIELAVRFIDNERTAHSKIQDAILKPGVIADGKVRGAGVLLRRRAGRFGLQRRLRGIGERCSRRRLRRCSGRAGRVGMRAELSRAEASLGAERLGLLHSAIDGFIDDDARIDGLVLAVGRLLRHGRRGERDKVFLWSFDIGDVERKGGSDAADGVDLSPV